MSLVILFDCTIVKKYEKIENLQGSVAKESALVYTLHWGNTQVEVVWTPHLLYVLPVSTNHPIEAIGLWVWAHFLYVSLSHMLPNLLKHEDMLFWGG